MISEHRILVVEEDQDLSRVIKILLRNEGYDVDVAYTAEEAITKSEIYTYSVAIIDVQLPDYDGIDLLSKLNEDVPPMRKIVMTGYPTLLNAIDAVNNNADVYLIKPVAFEIVVEKVKEQLKKYQEEKNYSQQKVMQFIETRLKEIRCNPR